GFSKSRWLPSPPEAAAPAAAKKGRRRASRLAGRPERVATRRRTSGSVAKSKGAFGRGHVGAFDSDGVAQAAGHGFERRFEHVVGVLAAAQPHVQGERRVGGEGAPELLGQLGFERRRTQRLTGDLEVV